MSQKNKNKIQTSDNHNKSRYYILLVFFITGTVLAWLLVFLFSDRYFKPLVWALSDEYTETRKATTISTDEVVNDLVGDLAVRRVDGVIVSPEDATNAFPVAIMIDNIPPAWPHSGLEAASIFYEALVEGGATRIMAVFAGGKSDKIGPIRSARPYYLEWVSEYDAFYGHVGGSPEALAAIDGLGIKDFSQFYNGQYFWRDQARYAPHNVYTSSELIDLALRDNGYDTIQPEYQTWKYKDEKPLEERPRLEADIEIRFSSGQTWVSNYRYDYQLNSYKKFQAGQPHIDDETGNQLLAKNVIVIVVPEITDYGEKGRITLDVTGEGRAFIFRDGEKIVGKWKKPGRLDRTLFYDESETEISLNRGTTWVSVVPADKEVLYQESGI